MITENGVSVQSRLVSEMAPVHGDRVQLQQVVLNLILNAVEAMSSVDAVRRELLISTERSEAREVLVAVSDSGPGIDPEHRERVFDSSTPPSPAEWGWVSPSAAPLSTRTGGGCRQMRMSLEALCFCSPCRQVGRIHEFPAGGLPPSTA